MMGDGGGEGVAGRGVLGHFPFDQAPELAQAQVATSIQVQFSSSLLLGVQEGVDTGAPPAESAAVTGCS